MKIVLLSGAGIIHTMRWANGLSSLGHEVHVVSQQVPLEGFRQGVILHKFKNLGKLGYFLMLSKVKKLIKEINPDIVHAHYASGYGTLARIINVRPWVLSVWGSDVLEFPKRSFFHRALIRKNLVSANAVTSTSVCMSEEVKRLAPTLSSIAIIPFGIEENFFVGKKSTAQQKVLTVGTVKGMNREYGVDILIRAFAQTLERTGLSDMRLRLVGKGSISDLEELACELGIRDNVDFVGQVPYDRVPGELEKLDIYLALSRNESFGVAVLEASAMGLPVIVSDAGGLPEVVVNGETGLIVEKDNPYAASEALEKLISDKQLRAKMGEAGIEFVKYHYIWEESLNKMNDIYKRVNQGRDREF